MKWFLNLVFCFLVACMLSGCVSNYPYSEKVVAYRPDIAARSFSPNVTSGGATPKTNEGAPKSSNRAVNILKRGDRITIYLFGAEPVTKIEDVVDDDGNVNLPLIGFMNIGGKSTSDAERLVEKKYIDDGFYNQMTVTIMKPFEGEYFVRGEVNNKQGKFPLTGDMTLLEAIATAGGFTVFANQASVKVIRDGNVYYYNINDMEAGKKDVPLIKPNDIVIVKKKWF